MNDTYNRCVKIKERMEDDMKITELLNESGIELGVSVKDKSSAIEILVNLHEKQEICQTRLSIHRP